MRCRQNAGTRRSQSIALQAFGVLIFIRELVFLLDTKAALPRKSDPGGAASLPRDTIALSRGSALRKPKVGHARPLASQVSAAKRRLRIGKIMGSKIIFFGICAVGGSRGLGGSGVCKWFRAAVVENGSGEDADPPSRYWARRFRAGSLQTRWRV